MKTAKFSAAIFFLFISFLSQMTSIQAHGNAAPQSVDTKGLKPLGKQWLEVNPFSKQKTPKQLKRAVEIGCAAYNTNCARCHGLGVLSGGVAPDLRKLERDDEGDEWFINRVRTGYHHNGMTKMPAFEGILSQEAMWAIRAYINIRPEDDDEAVVEGTGGNCQKLDYKKMLK